jgi:hypothetical protein
MPCVAAGSHAPGPPCQPPIAFLCAVVVRPPVVRRAGERERERHSPFARRPLGGHEHVIEEGARRAVLSTMAAHPTVVTKHVAACAHSHIQTRQVSGGEVCKGVRQGTLRSVVSRRGRSTAPRSSCPPSLWQE